VRYLALKPRKPGRVVKEVALEKGEVPELSNLVFALTVEQGKLFYGLDFAGLTPHSFDRGFDGKETRRDGAGAIPIGWFYTHTGGGCKSAFTCAAIGGRPAIGFRRLEGAPGPLFHSMALGDMAAGQRYLLRLEHRGEANFTGHVQVRRKSGEPENPYHAVKLGPTGGAWRLTEVEIAPTGRQPLVLAVQDTSRETERNGCQLRRIEVVNLLNN
jgi:hypothetical protein